MTSCWIFGIPAAYHARPRTGRAFVVWDNAGCLTCPSFDHHVAQVIFLYRILGIEFLDRVYDRS